MENKNHYQPIFDYIHLKTGLQLIESNEKAVKRYLDHQFLHQSPERYLLELEHNTDALNSLIEIYTIHETYFFREEKYYKLLKEIILPKYKEQKSFPPMIWSAAASSGEEAVSAALFIKSLWGEKKISHSPIVATDIDLNTLNKLKKGVYKKISMRKDGEIFHELIKQNAVISSESITITPEVLSLIQIKQINLLKDLYFPVLQSYFDIIFICNVLIYFNSAMRNEIIQKAVDVLKEDGYLIVSSSNTAFIQHPNLELLNYNNAFYFKKRKEK